MKQLLGNVAPIENTTVANQPVLGGGGQINAIYNQTSDLVSHNTNPVAQVQQHTAQQPIQGNVEQEQPSLHPNHNQQSAGANGGTRKVSALSLSSIRARKEMAFSLEKQVVNPEDLPKDHFHYDRMMMEWNSFSERLARSGLMLMSSLMGMTKPRLNGYIIELELPNHGSKISFDENKYELVNYLRKRLNNYGIEINITVNEEIKLAKKVFDSKDKYQHLSEINPEIELLREIFDLELK
ncbi:hypothetical protein VSP20_08555 [Myroides phaeus]|uniref:hypothetical protein n=1 Tax=Myroides phaeus TaxID=702745 RepID=UPI002DB75311|nr:hypothetical protein [Myroides phaeus]MEC4117019.1 hypothetical protein [Myroides phaeus]